MMKGRMTPSAGAGPKNSRRPSRMWVWLLARQLCGVSNGIWDKSRSTLYSSGVADPSFHQLSCFITLCAELTLSLNKGEEELRGGGKNFSPYVLKVEKRRNC